MPVIVQYGNRVVESEPEGPVKCPKCGARFEMPAEKRSVTVQLGNKVVVGPDESR